MKKKKDTRPDENPETIAMLVQLYKQMVTIDGKDDEDWAEVVANKWKSGEVNEKDVLGCQKLIPIIAVIQVSNFYTVNEKSGLNFDQARRLACKTQLIFLTKAEKDGRDLHQAFSESMKPYEDLVDAIFEGNYEQEKLEVLKSLPEHENWDKELGLKHYDTFFK